MSDNTFTALCLRHKIDGRPRPLADDEMTRLAEVILHHSQTSSGAASVATISYACLGCGSIGECANRSARDSNAKILDYECCGSVVTFESIIDKWVASNNNGHGAKFLDSNGNERVCTRPAVHVGTCYDAFFAVNEVVASGAVEQSPRLAFRVPATTTDGI